MCTTMPGVICFWFLSFLRLYSARRIEGNEIAGEEV
jgi:hypothetical protein